MRDALAAIQHEGFATVWVWVLQANTQAISFYASCGFVLQPDSCRLLRLGGQELAEVALVRSAALPTAFGGG